MSPGLHYLVTSTAYQQVRSIFKSVLKIQLVELRTQEALGQQHNGLYPVLQTFPLAASW